MQRSPTAPLCSDAECSGAEAAEPTTVNSVNPLLKVWTTTVHGVIAHMITAGDLQLPLAYIRPMSCFAGTVEKTSSSASRCHITYGERGDVRRQFGKTHHLDIIVRTIGRCINSHKVACLQANRTQLPSCTFATR